MSKKLTKIKITLLETDGSIRAGCDRMNKNSEKITLGRLYRLIGGYTQPTQQERTILCQYLQKPVRELFPEV